MQVEIKSAKHLDYDNRYELIVETQEGLTDLEYKSITESIEAISTIMDRKIGLTQARLAMKSEKDEGKKA